MRKIEKLLEHERPSLPLFRKKISVFRKEFIRQQERSLRSCKRKKKKRKEKERVSLETVRILNALSHLRRFVPMNSRQTWLSLTEGEGNEPDSQSDRSSLNDARSRRSRRFLFLVFPRRPIRSSKLIARKPSFVLRLSIPSFATRNFFSRTAVLFCQSSRISLTCERNSAVSPGKLIHSRLMDFNVCV